MLCQHFEILNLMKNIFEGKRPVYPIQQIYDPFLYEVIILNEAFGERIKF
jgi:acid stress-induced BolA-like protein IbaG/YrbA